jgi:hypothetical protein
VRSWVQSPVLREREKEERRKGRRTKEGRKEGRKERNLTYRIGIPEY